MGHAVNLDDFETHDTRALLPGLAVTVEPGVYLGHLGVRSEVNVLITEDGAVVTTPIQAEPYRLGVGRRWLKPTVRLSSVEAGRDRLEPERRIQSTGYGYACV